MPHASSLAASSASVSPCSSMCAAGWHRRRARRGALTAQSTQDVTIDSVMASCDVHFPVWLERLAYAHPKLSSVRLRRAACALQPGLTRARHWCLQYEPELSAGLTYRMATPKVVLRVYVSGKVTLTGGKVRRRLGRRRSLAPRPRAAL